MNTYMRKPKEVTADSYVPGMEDGFLVTRFSGKHQPVFRDDKNYSKYADRIDFEEVTPFINTPEGPLLINRGDMIITTLTMVGMLRTVCERTLFDTEYEPLNDH